MMLLAIWSTRGRLQNAQRTTVEGDAITKSKREEVRGYESPSLVDSNRVVAILSRLNEIKTVVEVSTQTGEEKEAL